MPKTIIQNHKTIATTMFRQNKTIQYDLYFRIRLITLQHVKDQGSVFILFYFLFLILFLIFSFGWKALNTINLYRLTIMHHSSFNNSPKHLHVP